MEDKEIKEVQQENLEGKKNNKNGILFVIIVFIIVFIGLLLFFYFNDKKEDNKKKDNNQQEQQGQKEEEEPKDTDQGNDDYSFIKITGLDSKIINNTNQEIIINGNSVKLRSDDYVTYVNDKAIDDFLSTHVIIMDKYAILLETGCQCALCMNKFIDEDGNVKDVKNMLPKSDQYRQFNDLKLENGNIVAEAEDCPCMDDVCEKPYKVKLVYNNKELSIEKNN